MHGSVVFRISKDGGYGCKRYIILMPQAPLRINTGLDFPEPESAPGPEEDGSRSEPAMLSPETERESRLFNPRRLTEPRFKLPGSKLPFRASILEALETRRQCSSNI